jgi:very-short-patch-repair endonuclease
MVVTSRDKRLCIICIKDGVKKSASCNYPGEKKRLYCGKHKLDGMINVLKHYCAFKGCQTTPSFNYEGETKGLYCKMHILPDMVNVVSHRCMHEGCNKPNPRFNYEGEIGGIYCIVHQLDGMTDVIEKRCEFEGCTRLHPIYNYEGLPKKYCSDHKLDGMVNVVSKRCLFEGCKRLPVYNYKGKTTGAYCLQHKLPDMISVAGHRCKEPGCNTRPIYNYKGKTNGLYCVRDKLDGMVDVVHKLCTNCNLFHVRTKPFLCSYCDPNKKKVKSREMIVKSFLEECKYEFIHNRSLKVCGNFRPDFLIDCGTHYVVVECDEDQHTQYDQDCENTRMVNIRESLGLYTVFIRYNPDTYKKNGETVRVYQKTRLKKLKERIDYHMKNPLNRTMTIEYLYYNE